MLAYRSLPLAAVRCVHPAHSVWSSSVKTRPLLQPIAMKWIARPSLSAAYSKDTKTTALGDTGIKLPSRDQVENFAFKSLVYFWDFVYYVFCLCRKLFETYVVNNSTVQQYWKRFLKRMEDARKELKTK